MKRDAIEFTQYRVSFHFGIARPALLLLKRSARNLARAVAGNAEKT